MKYIVLTGKSDVSDYLEKLDEFEKDVQRFLDNRNAQLIGGISITTSQNTIIFAQTLLIPQ